MPQSLTGSSCVRLFNSRCPM